MDRQESQDTLQSLPQSLSPTRMEIPAALRIIRAAGGRSVTPELLQADIDAGVPLNADGSFNLVYYAAWLIRAVHENA
jgi:hypothetical protein